MRLEHRIKLIKGMPEVSNSIKMLQNQISWACLVSNLIQQMLLVQHQQQQNNGWLNEIATRTLVTAIKWLRAHFRANNRLACLSPDFTMSSMAINMSNQNSNNSSRVLRKTPRAFLRSNLCWWTGRCWQWTASTRWISLVRLQSRNISLQTTWAKAHNQNDHRQTSMFFYQSILTTARGLSPPWSQQKAKMLSCDQDQRSTKYRSCWPFKAPSAAEECQINPFTKGSTGRVSYQRRWQSRSPSKKRSQPASKLDSNTKETRLQRSKFSKP